MLVLTRKVGERIQIGDDVTISVIRVQNGKVRLGIEAPDHIRVRRDELDESVLSHPAHADLVTSQDSFEAMALRSPLFSAR